MTPQGQTALERQEPVPEPSDAALMARVGSGDAAAFRLLVERHSPCLYRVAWRMLGDAGEAEDVVQEAFTRLWTHAPGWRPAGGGGVGWLRRVGVNLCFDRLRTRGRIVVGEAPDVSDERRPADQALDAEALGQATARCLAQLPERQRAVLVLSYYEALPNAESASIMGLNLKALESLLVRARRRMRELLEAEGVLGRDVDVLT